MKRILTLLMTLALLLGLMAVGMAEAPKGKLVILHTNDVHGRAVADPAGKEPDLYSFAAITDDPEPEVAAA